MLTYQNDRCFLHTQNRPLNRIFGRKLVKVLKSSACYEQAAVAILTDSHQRFMQLLAPERSPKTTSFTLKEQNPEDLPQQLSGYKSELERGGIYEGRGGRKYSEQDATKSNSRALSKSPTF